MEIYIVRQGDSVSSVAEKYGISAGRIIADNSLLTPDRLAVGQALLILVPDIVHTVRAGETLFSIAELYGTSVRQLIRNNLQLASREYIYPDETLVISYKDAGNENIGLSGFIYPRINRDILRQVSAFADYVIIFGYGFEQDGTLIVPDDTEISQIIRRAVKSFAYQ